MNSYARTSPSFVICTAPHGAGGRWRDPHLVSAPSSFTADASSGPSTTTTALHNGAGASSLPPSPSLMLGVDGTLVVSEWPVVSATAGSVDVFPLSRAGLKPRSVDSDQDGEGEEVSEGELMTQEEEKDENEMEFPPGPALFCRTRAVLVDLEEQGGRDGENGEEEEPHPLSPINFSSSPLPHFPLSKHSSLQPPAVGARRLTGVAKRKVCVTSKAQNGERERKMERM